MVTTRCCLCDWLLLVFFFCHNGGDELTHSRISFSQLWLQFQRHGQHGSDVILWAVHFHRQTEPLTSCADLAQSVEVVWTKSSDPDFDTVLLELRYRILQNFDHSGKRGCNSAGCAKVLSIIRQFASPTVVATVCAYTTDSPLRATIVHTRLSSFKTEFQGCPSFPSNVFLPAFF